MEDRIDHLNQTFLEQHGLQADEVVPGLPVGIVPAVTIPRGRYALSMGSNYIIEHTANLHTAMQFPAKCRNENDG